VRTKLFLTQAFEMKLKKRLL